MRTSTAGTSTIGNPTDLGAQDQERLAEAGEREHGRHGDDPPVGGVQAGKFGPAQGRLDGAQAGRALGLAHGKDDERKRQKGRNHRDPEHGREAVDRGPHQDDGQQRSDECADGIERLAQAEAGATDFGRRDVGDQRIPRRTANAFANAVDEAGGNEPGDGWRQREHRLGEGRQPVAQHGETFALAEPVGRRAGEDLGDGCGRLGDALDDAHCQRRGAEHGDEIDRQKRMDHLRGDVHEHGDEAERPDACGNIAPARPGGSSGGSGDHGNSSLGYRSSARASITRRSHPPEGS